MKISRKVFLDVFPVQLKSDQREAEPAAPRHFCWIPANYICQQPLLARLSGFDLGLNFFRDASG